MIADREEQYLRYRFGFDDDIEHPLTETAKHKAPKKYQAGLRSEFQEMFNSRTMAEARIVRDRIIEDYRDIAEAAVACLDEGFESAMTVMLLPVGLRRYYRTTNHLERLNKELKRHMLKHSLMKGAGPVFRSCG